MASRDLTGLAVTVAATILGGVGVGDTGTSTSAGFPFAGLGASAGIGESGAAASSSCSLAGSAAASTWDCGQEGGMWRLTAEGGGIGQGAGAVGTWGAAGTLGVGATGDGTLSVGD